MHCGRAEHWKLLSSTRPKIELVIRYVGDALRGAIVEVLPWMLEVLRFSWVGLPIGIPVTLRTNELFAAVFLWFGWFMDGVIVGGCSAVRLSLLGRKRMVEEDEDVLPSSSCQYSNWLCWQLESLVNNPGGLKNTVFSPTVEDGHCQEYNIN